MDKLWQKFEQDVEQLFRAAGFSTERNVELEGFEYDVIATKEEFASVTIRIAVECKYLSSGMVGNTDVHTFLAAYTNSKGAGHFTHAIIVTNTRFSRQAHEASIHKPNVKLTTYSNLEDDLLGAQAYLRSAKNRYRAHIAHHFIDLAAIQLLPDGRRKRHDHINSHIQHSLATEDGYFVFLLGDFGSGKTTIAEQIHRHFADLYLSGDNSVFPFIFYLRTLAQFDNEDGFVTAQFGQSSNYISPHLFNLMQSKTATLLILDGFDEVATNATEDERLGLFSKIMRLSQRASHLVITSRPSYFTNLDEANRLVEHLIHRDFDAAQRLSKRVRRVDDSRNAALVRASQLAQRKFNRQQYRLFSSSSTAVYYIQPFTRDNIIEYFSPYASAILARHGKSVEAVYDILSQVYDLTDLLTRPLLIEMFVEILLKGNLSLSDPDLEIGPAGLYQIYVNLHLDRDWTTRQFLTREERLGFARATAVAMLQAGGSLEASYKSIEAVVGGAQDWLEAGRWSELRGQMAKVVNDVRVCAFINVTTQDRIEFSHKSFMEYFVADVVVMKLAANRPIAEFDTELNYEILYFVGSYCLLRQDHRIELLNHLRDIAYRESERYRANVNVAILYCERKSSERRFWDFSFEALTIRKREFSLCHFQNVKLQRLIFDDIEFSATDFVNVLFAGSIGNVSFHLCTGALHLDGIVRNAAVRRCVQFGLSGANDRLQFEGGTWDDSDLLIDADSVALDAIRIRNTQLHLQDVRHLNLSHAKLNNSGIEVVRDDKGALPPTLQLLLDGVRFENVRVGGIRLSRESFLELKGALNGCYGFVFVDDDAEEITSFNHKVPSDRKDAVTRYVGWAVQGSLLFVNILRFKRVVELEGRIFAVSKSENASEALRVFAESELSD